MIFFATGNLAVSLEHWPRRSEVVGEQNQREVLARYVRPPNALLAIFQKSSVMRGRIRHWLQYSIVEP